MKELIENIKHQILAAFATGSGPKAKSWRMQSGVLLSIEEADLLVKHFESLQSKGKTKTQWSQLFKNNSDCYADTWIDIGTEMKQGEVIQAMTEEKFVELMQSHANKDGWVSVEEIREIMKIHNEKLSTMKSNRAVCYEERWSDAEIQECDRMIGILAPILSDLNRALTP